MTRTKNIRLYKTANDNRYYFDFCCITREWVFRAGIIGLDDWQVADPRPHYFKHRGVHG